MKIACVFSFEKGSFFFFYSQLMDHMFYEISEFQVSYQKVKSDPSKQEHPLLQLSPITIHQSLHIINSGLKNYLCEKLNFLYPQTDFLT